MTCVSGDFDCGVVWSQHIYLVRCTTSGQAGTQLGPGVFGCVWVCVRG